VNSATLDLFRAAMTYLATSKEADYQMVERLKSLNNYLDARIEQALRTISKRQLSDAEATEVVFLVRMSNEIERLGDLGARTSGSSSAGCRETGTASLPPW